MFLMARVIKSGALHGIIGEGSDAFLVGICIFISTHDKEFEETVRKLEKLHQGLLESK